MEDLLLIFEKNIYCQNNLPVLYPISFGRACNMYNIFL